MTNDSPFKLHDLLFAALAPQYWARWVLGNAVLVFLFFASLGHHGDPQSNDPEQFTRTGVYLTAFSWVLLVVLAYTLVHGFMVCMSLQRGYAAQGTPVEEASPVQLVTARPSAPVTPPTALPALTPAPVRSAAPAPARPRIVVVSPVASGKARSTEEHEHFDIVDRRRFAHLVE